MRLKIHFHLSTFVCAIFIFASALGLNLLPTERFFSIGSGSSEYTFESALETATWELKNFNNSMKFHRERTYGWPFKFANRTDAVSVSQVGWRSIGEYEPEWSMGSTEDPYYGLRQLAYNIALWALLIAVVFVLKRSILAVISRAPS